MCILQPEKQEACHGGDCLPTTSVYKYPQHYQRFALPHCSRFAKNLSPDKINLSTLKGEGQLTNLELDEEVLQSLLDLPTWLAINRVFCNKAAIRVRVAIANLYPGRIFISNWQKSSPLN